MDAYPFEKWHVLKNQFEAGKLQVDGEYVNFLSSISFEEIYRSEDILRTEEPKEWNVIEFFCDFKREAAVKALNVLRQINFTKRYRYNEEFASAWLKMNLNYQIPRFAFSLPLYVYISGAEPSIENTLKVHITCHKRLLPLTLQSSTYKRNINWPFEKNSASLKIWYVFSSWT